MNPHPARRKPADLSQRERCYDAKFCLMKNDASIKKRPGPPNAGMFKLLTPYRGLVVALVALTILGNGLNLVVPKIMANTIDTYGQPNFVLRNVLIEFFAVSAGIFGFGYFQSVVQIYTSERIAKNLRTQLAGKISFQDHMYIQQVTPAKLLTNFTSDVDAVKTFVSQAIPQIISSIFLIIGAGVLLLSINWKLGLAVLAILPVIGITFSVVLGKVRKLLDRKSVV